MVETLTTDSNEGGINTAKSRLYREWSYQWGVIGGLVLCGVVLLLVGCRTNPAERIYPTIGPISSASGDGRIQELLIANTDCAEAGDTITITVQLTNRGTTPITYTGSSPLDIVINPIGFQERIPTANRWSASSVFPASIDSVLQPGEVRRYNWAWTIPLTYTYEQSHITGLIISLQISAKAYVGDYIEVPAGESNRILVGVGWKRLGQGEVSCATIRQQEHQ